MKKLFPGISGIDLNGVTHVQLALLINKNVHELLKRQVYLLI
jgi:hypothetical protein